MSRGIDWNWSGGWKQRLTPAALARAAAINAELLLKVESAQQRLAGIPDDDDRGAVGDRPTEH
jgi:hypothetical protein